MNTMKKFDFESRLGKWGSRLDIWIEFIKFHNIHSMVEIGVFRGEFAERILRESESLKTYHMIDPWKNLEAWNKPANEDNETFERYYLETLDRTDFAVNIRNILRGKTTEVIGEIPDESIDFAYIDGDHTLKGITIDLVSVYPKIRDNGWIAGDDFSRTIWQHPKNFEPTLVFPFAAYFAEAMSMILYALPFNQFLLKKSRNQQFEFIDLAGGYDDASIRNQLLESS